MSGRVGRHLVGRYVLVDPIASGGMGTVWRVWDVQQARYVAAKLLRPADADSLLRFVREQSLRVRHPHVAAPTGWAAEDDQVLLTMDLVRGGNVERLLADRGPLPLPFVAVLVDQLLDALDAVHGHGIVHRDVKPSNLLLEPTGWGRPLVRLADFGIAAVRGEPRLTQYGHAIGTPGYLAPERLRGAEPEPRQDLYAVGAVAARLLTAQPPGERRLAALPGPVRAVIEALAAGSPQDRPGSAAAARRDWRAALDRAGVPPVEGGPDAVEVVERLDPLPDGFAPDGPVTVVAGAEETVRIGAVASPKGRTLPDGRRPRLGRPPVVVAGVVALAAAVGVPWALASHGDTPPASAQSRSSAPPVAAQTTTPSESTTSAAPTTITPPSSQPAAEHPPASTVISSVVRTVVPVDDSFSVRTTDGCGGADYVDHGPPAPGAANPDSVVVHDYCADGHGVKAWVHLDGADLGSRYNGNGQAGAPVIWNPFPTLKPGQRITISVCLVDGSSGNSPAKCAERTVAVVDG